jgi:glycosyltransferase involved in cell wall biosynthesis/SAM-dependent methyltransferase
MTASRVPEQGAAPLALPAGATLGEADGLPDENAYGHARRLRWILSHMRRTDRIVEVGCGTGLMIALPMAKMGFSIVAVDTHEPSIEAGKRLFQAAGLDPGMLRAALPTDVDARPDTVIASEVLEHIPDPGLEEMLRVIRNALPPGGRLLVTVPNGYGWFELESVLWFRVGVGAVVERLGVDRRIRRLKSWLFGWKPDDETRSSLADSPHVQRFTHRSIQERLARAGFEVVEITGSVLFAGPFSNLLFTGARPLMALNCALGAWFPRIAAGFYIACRVGGAGPGQPSGKRPTAVGEASRVRVGSQPGCAPGSDGRITVLKDCRQAGASAQTGPVVRFEDLVGWIKRGAILRHLLRYRDVRLVTLRLGVTTKPLQTALVLRALSRGRCTLEDEPGSRLSIGFSTLGRLTVRFARDLARRPGLLRRVSREVERLTREYAGCAKAPRLDLGARPVYLRTDLWFGVRSGGSVGHIAGVLNHLDRFAGTPVFLTSDAIPTVRADLETHRISPGSEFWDFGEVPGIAFTDPFEREAARLIGDRRPAFIYQRYSLNNYAGVKLARRCGVPFVLEYNGSEIWVNRNWGTPLKYEWLSARIEVLNLAAADLVVVVSRPLKDDLVSRGVAAEKVLVNPNGVDPDRYSPDVDGSAVRRRYDLADKTVVGFIGTFGPWHGAEVLAEAFGRLLTLAPAYRDRVRLLLVGDGNRMGQVREALARYRVGDAAVLTGLVPQAEGPVHLAACDVLASPHVPNPDGTAFFGSPTKLFEYMAMGKGIVAARLGQIGEVLAHDETAWLVTPGDVEDLARGLKTLVDDVPRRERLGTAARREVVAKHSWLEHTRKIIEALKARCG